MAASGVFHLIATTTVMRLKRHQADPRAPQVIATGSFDACYARAVLIGGSRCETDRHLLLGEIPVLSNETWTYYIVAGAK